jgi:uncharacterized protein (TIGR03437 family)
LWCGAEYGIVVGEHPQLGPAPSFSQGGVVQAATGTAGAIAAGEIVSLFGLFTYAVSGKSYTLANRSDGGLQGPTAPLARGSAATFWATGVGLPAGAEGNAVGVRPQQLDVTPVLTLGGVQARILYAGPSVGATVGLTQLNVEIPSGCPAGTVEAVLSIGGERQAGVWVVLQ